MAAGGQVSFSIIISVFSLLEKNVSMEDLFVLAVSIVWGPLCCTALVGFRRDHREFAESDCSFRHVCTAARNNWTPTGRISMEFYTSLFFDTFEKLYVSLKFDINKGT